MPGQFIRTDSDFPNHPKTLRLERILGPGRGGHLVYLWMWASLYRRDGALDGMTDEDIEAVVRWSGTPGAFMTAATHCGFIDGEVERRRIHGWKEKNRHFAELDRRQQDAIRARRHRSTVTPSRSSHGATVTPSGNVTPRGEERRSEEKREGSPPTPSRPTVERPSRSHPASASRGEQTHDPPMPARNGDRPDLGSDHVGDLARAWPWEPGEEFPPRLFFQVPELVGRDAGLTRERNLELWTAFLDSGHRRPGDYRAFVAFRVPQSEPPPASSPDTPIHPPPARAGDAERDGTMVHALVESLRRAPTKARRGSQEPESLGVFAGVRVEPQSDEPTLEDDPLPPVGGSA